MSALRYLLFIKWKAAVRNIFSKPVSAVITVIAFVFFAVFLVMSVTFGAAPMIQERVRSLEYVVTMILGYVFIITVILLAQKRTAIVFSPDAVYIFGGPFTRRQVLTYLLIDTARGCLMFTLFTVYFLMVTVSSRGVSLSFLLWSAISFFSVYYTLFAAVTLFYLREAAGRSARKIKILAGVVILALFAALAARNVVASGFDVGRGLLEFTHDPAFFAVPIFGWTKLVMISAALHDATGILIGLGLNLLLATAVSALILGFKGDFYERVVEDAEWITSLRQNAEKGKNDGAPVGGKIRAIGRYRFREGAFAVLSKNILQMRKTKSWIRKQEIFMIVMYIFIAKMSDMNYTGFQYFIMIVVFISISSDAMESELRTPYIYLIPDTPFRKIMSIAAPVFLRTCIIVLCSLAAAAFVFRVSVGEFLAAALTMCGYAAVFDAGCLWSVRLLKSGTNRIAEQFIKMGIVLVGCIPAMIISAALVLTMGPAHPSLLQIMGIVTIAVNLLTGFVFISMAKGVFKGNDIMAE